MSDESAPEHKDRSRWIVLAGAVPLICGVLFCLGALLPVVGFLNPAKAAPSETESANVSRTLVTGLSLGAVLVWLGIGVRTLRRWAGDLALAFSIAGVAMGVLGALAISAVLAGRVLHSASDAPPSAGAAIAVYAGLALFLGLVLTSVPGLFAYFFSRPSVRWTFRKYDPGPSWADRCPVPVLWLVVMNLLGAGAATGRTALPVCGTVLRGWLALGWSLGHGILLLLIGWGLYRMSFAAWLGALLMEMFNFVSGVLNGLYVDFTDLFHGVDPDKVTAYRAGWEYMHWSLVPWSLVLVGYLLYVLRFFRKRKEPPQADELQANS